MSQRTQGSGEPEISCGEKSNNRRSYNWNAPGKYHDWLKNVLSAFQVGPSRLQVVASRNLRSLLQLTGSCASARPLDAPPSAAGRTRGADGREGPERHRLWRRGCSQRRLRGPRDRGRFVAPLRVTRTNTADGRGAVLLNARRIGSTSLHMIWKCRKPIRAMGSLDFQVLSIQKSYIWFCAGRF